MIESFEVRTELCAQAETLRRLHREDLPLVLPNAWDVPSACVFARHPRCRALGTSSAGISATLGYAEGGHPAGESVPPTQMLEAIGRISRVSRAVGVPLSADLESGYGDSPDGVADRISWVSPAWIGHDGSGIDHCCPSPIDGLSPRSRRCDSVHATVDPTCPLRDIDEVLPRGSPAPSSSSRWWGERVAAHPGQRLGRGHPELRRYATKTDRPELEMMGDIGIDDRPGPPVDPARWLNALTPCAAADMRGIIEATNPRLRAVMVGLALDNGRSWRNIATAITVNKQRPPVR